MTIPSCCLIGDSISLDYAPFLIEGLLDRVTYHRKDGIADAQRDLDRPRGANGGDSSMVLSFLQERLAEPEPGRYDLLLLNCGLHDIKVDKVSGTLAVGAEAYRRNLEEILHLAPRIADRIAWIRTTPIDDERHALRQMDFHRHQRDIDRYNTIADMVMADAGVPTIDLATFTIGCDTEPHRDGVHFLEAIRQRQGAWLAGWILATLLR